MPEHRPTDRPGDARAPRRTPPVPPAELIVVPAPPATPDDTVGAPIAQSLMMTAGMLGGLVFLVINPTPLFIFAGVLFLLGAVGVGAGWAVQYRTRTRRVLRAARAGYVEVLAACRRYALHRDRLHHDRSWQLHPDLLVLPGLAHGRRLHERRRTDPDFLHVRVGVGDVAARTPFTLAPPPTGRVDPLSLTLARRLTEHPRYVPNLPVALPLGELRVVELLGAGDRVRALATAVLLHAACWHAPRDLTVLLACPADRVPRWDWLKWLPHRHPEVFTDATELDAVLTPEAVVRTDATPGTGRDLPHLLVVTDGLGLRGTAALGVLAQHRPSGLTVLVLDHQPDRVRWSDATATVDQDGALSVHLAAAPLASTANTAAALPDEPAAHLPRTRFAADNLLDRHGRARADQLDPASAAWLARSLVHAGGHRLDTATSGADVADLPTLLGIADVADPEHSRLWQECAGRDLLRTPLGRGTDGGPGVVELDLKEAATGGMGPHGVIIGATGSGKSELLRTLVLGLAMTHPPEQLSFVLTDFKGGAAFADLAPLPHLAGLITNLADDEALVERMLQAVYGEIQRRQQLLRDAGHLASVADYQHRRKQDPDLPALPYLVLVVDEFSELLVARPDFADLFAAVGRLGRSLGLHLVLASQRLDEGRIRGLESHLSYRIALRTFSRQDSSAVLGIPDAYHLPHQPGWALLKLGSDPPRRFRTTCVSRAATRPPTDAEQRARLAPRRFTLAVPDSGPASAEPDRPADSPTTVVQAAMAALTDESRRTHQIWLPPLPPVLDLTALLPSPELDPDRGLCSPWVGSGQLQVPVGVVDQPRQQRYDTLVLGLAGDAGSVQLCGGPRTGKTTFLTTFVLSLALTHTPDEARVYCLDYGGALTELAGLPHVGAVIARADTDRARRLVRVLLDLVAQRAAVPGTRSPEVFLCVDTIADLRSETPELDEPLRQLARRGLSVGVHVVLTASRWADVPTALRDAIGTRLELRLNEPADSMLDRPAARAVPVGAPGRGIVPGGLAVQYALPGPAVAQRVRQVRDAWPGEPAPPVRVLPDLVPFHDLPTPGSDRHPGVPIGLGDHELAPVYLDLTGTEPHLLVLGEARTGKTGLLRTVLTGLTRRARPEQLRVAVVDYRRGLLDAVDERFLLGYAGSAPATAEVLGPVAETLRSRLPAAGLNAQQLRSRSWWRGPEIYVVIDDYDLVESPLGNQADALVEFLPVAADIGLHVLITRRTGGASRALLMPMLQRLVDFGATAVLLSGDAAEGPLVAGVRAGPLPCGRGRLVRGRDDAQLVQTALIRPAHPDLDPEHVAVPDGAPHNHDRGGHHG